jgi:hypothetical protein
MSLMIYRGGGAARKKIFVFAADFLAYIEKPPLKALALRRPVVHKRLFDFVALWSYIQRATPRGEQKKICIFFFRAAQTRLSSGSSLRNDSGTTLTRSAPSALPTHFFRGPESWGLSQGQRSPDDFTWPGFEPLIEIRMKNM